MIDINPEKHVFSTITFPSVPSATLATPNPISFPTFMSGLQKRSVYRTPLLDQVLLVVEDLARDLKADISDLPDDLISTYGDLVTAGLGRLSDVLAAMLAKSVEGKPDSGDVADQRIYAELFVGRVALFLARQSTFLQDITAESAGSSSTLSFGIISEYLGR